MPVPSRGEDLSVRTRSIVSCRAAGTDAQVNAAPLEILDGFERLLQRSPEAGDAKPVAGPGMIDQLGQHGLPRLLRNTTPQPLLVTGNSKAWIGRLLLNKLLVSFAVTSTIDLKHECSYSE